MSIPEKYRSLFYSLTAVLFWSTIATAFKLTLNGMNNAQILFYSSLTSFLVLGVIAYNKNKDLISILFYGKNLKRNALLGFINPFFYYLILIKAYDLLEAQEAMIVNYSWPIVFSVFSVIFLKEKLSGKTIVGLISAFLGVAFIATRGDLLSLKFHNPLGGLLALASTLIWASFWIINLRDSRDNHIKLFGAFFFGSLYTTIYILFFDSFKVENPVYILGAVYVGLFEMGITFTLWLKGLSLSTNRANTSTFVFLSPFLSLLFIAFVLGEKLYFSSIAGLALIIGGILFQQFSKKKNQESLNV